MQNGFWEHTQIALKAKIFWGCGVQGFRKSKVFAPTGAPQKIPRTHSTRQQINSQRQPGKRKKQSWMSRGNQREIDRARAQARHAGKGTEQEGDPASRRLADGLALKAKVEAKKKADAEAAERLAAEEEFKKAVAAACAASTGGAMVEETKCASPVIEKKKSSKKKADLSFLDAMVNPGGKKK